MKLKIKIFVVSMTVFLLMPLVASAVTLDVVGGQLMGAFDVDVNGTLYDVSFLDGTCIALFNGCDQLSDFTFQDALSAQMATEVLMGTVFVDTLQYQFDTSPALTNGVENTFIGTAATPFQNNNSSVLVFLAGNTTSEQSDYTQSNSWLINGNTNNISVYAVWSQAATVPEPSTYLLLGSGLLGMVFYRRKEAQV